jgi:hypothetical protein
VQIGNTARYGAAGYGLGGVASGVLGQIGDVFSVPRRLAASAIMSALGAPNPEAQGLAVGPPPPPPGFGGGEFEGDGYGEGMGGGGPWEGRPPGPAPAAPRSLLSQVLSGGGYDVSDLLGLSNPYAAAVANMALDPLAIAGAAGGALAGRLSGARRADPAARLQAAGRPPAMVVEPPPPQYIAGSGVPIPSRASGAPLESEAYLGMNARPAASPLAAALSAGDEPVRVLNRMPPVLAVEPAAAGAAANPAVLEAASASSLAGYRPEMIDALPGLEQLALSGGRLGQPVAGLARRYKQIDPALEEALLGYGWMSDPVMQGGKLGGTLNYGPGQLPPFAAVRGGGVRPAGAVPPAPAWIDDFLASPAGGQPLFSPSNRPAMITEAAGPPTSDMVARAMAQESLRRLRAGTGAADRRAMLERLRALEAQNMGPNIDWVQRL